MLKNHLRVKRAMDTGRAIGQARVGKGTWRIVFIVIGIYVAVTILVAILKQFAPVP